ncbi:MAG: hypothetical protein JNK78_02555 [Planctomycetes bacterium]|nr:hypothetical protein [Planctomycetota bacterium]
MTPTTTTLPLFRALALVLLAAFPALAQSVTATVTAATQLIVTAGTNTNTRPAGTNVSAGLNLGASYQSGPIFVTVNSVFGLATTSSSITHTIQESMSGVNATRTAGPHATLLTLSASQPVSGTLIVQYSPGTVSGGSSNASIDIGNDGTAEWTRAPGTSAQTWQIPVTVSGTLPIRVMTSMVATSHSLSVQFTNWTPLPQLPLVNPGFENGLGGWAATGDVQTWLQGSRSGLWHCVLWDLAPVRPSISQRFAANAGETYALHCYGMWGDVSPGSDVAQARIEFLDALGAVTGSASTTVLGASMPNNTWIGSETLMATAPSGTVAVRVTLLGFAPVLPVASRCHFDDVSFARVDGCGAFALPVGGTPGIGTTVAHCFTLDVTTPHGIAICSIDLTPNSPAGLPQSATVYLHRSVTEYSQLTPSLASPGNWCPIAKLQGVSNGAGVVMSFGITNATNSLRMPPGQYLIGIVGEQDSSLGQTMLAMTTGSLLVTDAGNNVTLRDGKVAGSLSYPMPAGDFVAKLHFDILTAPTLPSTCAAEGVEVGTGCGGEPNSVFEVFDQGSNAWDLSSNDVVVTGNGTGGSLSTAPATPLVPYSNGIVLSGGVTAPFPLGFDLGAFGLPNVSDFRVCLHGSIFFGGIGNTTGVDTNVGVAPGLMSNDSVARLAAYWSSFAYYSTVYVDVTPGVQAIVTYPNMEDTLFAAYRTFQVVITPTTMRIRYPSGSFPYGLVGFHNGIPLPTPPSAGRVDLTAGPSPFTNLNARADLALSAQNRPVLGTNFDVTLDHNPLIAGVFLDVAPLGAGVPLPTPLFAPACTFYVGLDAVIWSLTLAPTSTSSIPIAMDTSLLGLDFGLQGVGLLADTLFVSNGIRAEVGHW